MNENFIQRYKELKKIIGFDNRKEIRRGTEFEKLILDIFDYHKLLIRRSYHTDDNKSEQIDGAVEFANQIALIEVKWKESNIAASELYSFCGKIDNKFLGTIGIFISKESLSDNFINSLNKGRRQNVIIMHGKDIENMINKDFQLEKFLIETRKFLSTDNINYISTNRFIEQFEELESKIEEKQKISEKCKSLLKKLISKQPQDTDRLLIELESECNFQEKIFILFFLIKEVMTLDLEIVYLPIMKRNSRIYKTINYLIDDDELLKESWPKYFQEFNGNPKNYLRSDFLEKYSKIISNLKGNDMLVFKDALVNTWVLIFGDWNSENVLAKLTEKLWGKLDRKHKHTLREFFFEIIASYRSDRFPQKQFAEKIIKNESAENPKLLEKNVLNWLDKKIKEERKMYKKTEINSIDVHENSSFFAKSYNEIRLVLHMKNEEWQETIREIYDKNYRKEE